MKIIKDFYLFLKNKKSFLEFKDDRDYFFKQVKKLHSAMTKEECSPYMDIGWYYDNTIKLIKENKIDVLVEVGELRNKLVIEEAFSTRDKTTIKSLESQICDLQSRNYKLYEEIAVLEGRCRAYLGIQ